MKTSVKLKFAMVALTAGLFSGCRSGDASPGQDSNGQDSISQMPVVQGPDFHRLDSVRQEVRMTALNHLSKIGTRERVDDLDFIFSFNQKYSECMKADTAYAVVLREAIAGSQAAVINDRLAGLYGERDHFLRACGESILSLK